MINKTIRILTRDSFLAMAQTIQVSDFLIKKGYTVEVKALKTTGDIKLDAPLYQISSENSLATDKEGKAYFTKELEDGLLSGEGDLAVHSLKDLPTQLPKGLSFAGAIMPVETTDTLVTMEKLPECPREQTKKINQWQIGSSSLRRIALIKKWLPQSQPVSVRGNLVTRLEKLQNHNGPQALILATAGLKRLHAFFIYWGQNKKLWENKLDTSILARLDKDHDRLAKIFSTKMYFYEFEPDMFLPAVSQGVLGLESRDEDVNNFSNIFSSGAEVDMLAQRIKLERNLLTELEAGCHIPYGNYVEMEKSEKLSYFKICSFFARHYNPQDSGEMDYSHTVRLLPENYGKHHTEVLVREIKAEKFPVILCGLENQAFLNHLNNAGFYARHIPLIESSAVKSGLKLHDKYSVAIVASKNCVDFFPEILPEIDYWIAVGDKTAAYIKSNANIKKIIVPETNDGVSAAKLAMKILSDLGKAGKDILWFGALNGKKDGIDYLKSNAMDVTVYTGYETKQIDFKIHQADTEDKQSFIDKIQWWVFTSPSSVQSYLDQNLHRKNHLVSAIGNSTASIFFKNGIVPYHISQKSDLEILAEEIMGINNSAQWKITEWSI